MNTTDIQKYYDGFLEHLKFDHQRRNPRHTKVFTQLAQIIKPEMTVLDLGCGTGITSHHMASELNAHVTGVDLSPGLIAFARQHSAHTNLAYHVHDISQVTLMRELCGEGKTQTYDAITMIDCIEHLPLHQFSGLLWNIQWLSHDETVLYVNIPDGRFQEWIQKAHKERLQIVDEAWRIEDLLCQFRHIGYEPTFIDIYGLDLPIQYNSYVFARAKRLHDTYVQCFS